MKRKILNGIKIYTFLISYILLCSFIYSFYLTKNNESKIIELIIGSTTFFLLGTLYSNTIQKKGILIGLLTGIIHYMLIRIIYYLTNNTFNINIITLIIFTISSTIGGILGIFFKKIF